MKKSFITSGPADLFSICTNSKDFDKSARMTRTCNGILWSVFGLGHQAYLRNIYDSSVNYCMVCASVREDNPRALASGLKSLQTQNHI